MATKYAIRITEENFDLVQFVNVTASLPMTVKEGTTFFLFTVASNNTILFCDVVHKDDLEIYDGDDKTPRIIIQ